MDRPTAACGTYDVVKDSAGNRPPTNDFKGNLSKSSRVHGSAKK